MTGDVGPTRTVNLSSMTVDVKVSELLDEYRTGAKKALDKIKHATAHGDAETPVAQEAQAPVETDTVGEKTERNGAVCQGLSPEKLESIRNDLASELEALAVVRAGLIEEFWHKGPIETVSGSAATADAVIAKVQEEARLIRQHVANIQSLDVTIEVSEQFDGVTHDGPEDHIFVNMARRFRNGGVDLIFHHVVRTGDDRFAFAYMRL